MIKGKANMRISHIDGYGGKRFDVETFLHSAVIARTPGGWVPCEYPVRDFVNDVFCFRCVLLSQLPRCARSMAVGDSLLVRVKWLLEPYSVYDDYSGELEDRSTLTFTSERVLSRSRLVNRSKLYGSSAAIDARIQQDIYFRNGGYKDPPRMPARKLDRYSRGQQ